MKWMEVTIFTTEEGLDPVCARLDMLGINQVMIEQGRESIEQFLRDTAKYWDYADMDRLVTSDEPCVKAYIADVADNRATVRAIEDSFAELKNTEACAPSCASRTTRTGRTIGRYTTSPWR